MKRSEPEQIGNLLGIISKDMHKLLKIKAEWKNISGEVLAAHTIPARLKGSKLQVLCDSPIWSQQLELLQLALIENIKKSTGLRLKEIESKMSAFKTASLPISRSKEHGRVELNIDSRAYESISNPELRERIRALIKNNQMT